MSSNTYCPICGAEVKGTDTFCTSCGASLTLSKQTTTTTPTQQQPAAYPYQPQRQPTTYPQQLQQPPPVVHTQVYVTKQSNGAAVASLVTGIIGFVLQFIPFLALLAPVLLLTAFITGIIGLTKPHGKGMAIAGLILSLFSLVIFILLIVFLSAIFLPFFF